MTEAFKLLVIEAYLDVVGHIVECAGDVATVLSGPLYIDLLTDRSFHVYDTLYVFKSESYIGILHICIIRLYVYRCAAVGAVLSIDDAVSVLAGR